MSETGRPEVILDVVFEDGALFLALRNIGDRPALHVETRFRRALMGLGGTKDLRELALFRRLEFLGPGREIRTLLDSSAALFRRRQSTKVAVTISYADPEGKRYETSVQHDLAVYREVAYVIRRD